MIVIDRRDDPLFVIRLEGRVTLEDLYEYRRLCDDLELRCCSYATVWVDETIIPVSQPTQALMTPHERHESGINWSSLWTSFLRILSV